MTRLPQPTVPITSTRPRLQRPLARRRAPRRTAVALTGDARGAQPLARVGLARGAATPFGAAAALATMSSLGACAPLDDPAAGASAAASEPWTVRPEPAAPDGSPLPESRFVIEPPSGWITDASTTYLFDGALSTHHQRQAEAGELGGPLNGLRLPAALFPRDARSVELAPLDALVPGAAVTVAAAGAGQLGKWTVADAEGASLERVWPPVEVPTRVVVWCGDTPLGGVAEDVPLSPAGAFGRLLPGLGADGRDDDCVRLELPGSSDEEWLLAPARLRGRTLAHPFVRPGPAPLPEPLPCASSAAVADAVCVELADDRLVVTARHDGLYVVDAGELRARWPLVAGAQRVLRGLVPDSDVEIGIWSLHGDGSTRAALASGRTRAPEPHLVLSEVFANAVGPEPASEWVELFNDGAVPVELGGWTLEDLGGELELPPVELGPGAFAVILAEDHPLDPELDVAPSADAVLVRVPRVGQSGLSNAGELLRLRDPDGVVRSRFPALAASDAGVSWARVAPEGADDDPETFRPHASPGSSPGAPNRVDAP